MGGKSMWWGLLAVVLLAGLDLVGALLAKEYSTRPRPIVFLAGVIAFGVLFGVYVASLRVSELWIVTFGWIVLLEIGVLAIERFQFGTAISHRKLALAGVLLVAQVLLMLPESDHDTAATPVEPPSAVVVPADSPLSSADVLDI